MTASAHGRAGVAWLCASVAILAAAASAFGIFARGDGSFVTVESVRGEVYDMATTGVYAYNAQQVVAEGVGWDVFTLAVGVPVMLAAAFFVARGSFLGTLAAAGMLGYFGYMYLEYAVTWAFGPLFPLFVAILAASVVGLVGVGSLLAGEPMQDRFDARFPRRAWAALSVGMSAMLVLMWGARIAQGLTGQPELHGETTMTVQALDLGLVVPGAVLIAVAAWRRSPAGLAAATAFAVMFVALSAAIASMMVSASIATGVLQLPPIVIFGLAAVAGLAVLARMAASVATGPASVSASRAAPAAGSRPALEEV
jgi:hypothetical protein